MNASQWYFSGRAPKHGPERGRAGDDRAGALLPLPVARRIRQTAEVRQTIIQTFNMIFCIEEKIETNL